MADKRQPPSWEQWDPDSGAKTFHNSEITLCQPRQQPAITTVYRQDYPKHELWWKHPPPPDPNLRPVPDFNHTSSHRDQFRAWKLGDGASVAPAYPERKYNPKLSGTTTTRASYIQPALPPKMSYGPKREARQTDVPIGTTTMRSSYQPWTLPGAHFTPAGPAPREIPFNGTTTTRADYQQPAELPPPPAGKNNPPHVVSKFDGTTEYRAKYEQVPLPPGAFGALGLQIASKAYKFGGIGGQFCPMIPQGSPAPQQASKTFTTVVDDQTTASIIVVCKRNDAYDGLILGYFNLEGLRRGVVGSQKVEVSLKLTNEKTLHASATYSQGGKTKALTFTSAKGPPLRAVTTTDEVPSGMY